MKKLTRQQNIIKERAFAEYSKNMSRWRMWLREEENAESIKDKKLYKEYKERYHRNAMATLDFFNRFVLNITDYDDMQKAYNEWFDRWYEESKNNK